MKYKVNKDMFLQKLDKSLIGFDTQKSLIYTFNETAEFIFKKLKLGWEEEEVVEALKEKYGISLLTLKKDVKTLIKDMLKNKIIYSTRSK